MKKFLFDSQVKEIVAKESIVPNKDLWERLSLELARDKATFKGHEISLKRRKLIFGYARVACLLGVVLGVVYFFNHKSPQSTSPLKSTYPVAVSPVKLPLINENKDINEERQLPSQTLQKPLKASNGTAASLAQMDHTSSKLTKLLESKPFIAEKDTASLEIVQNTAAMQSVNVLLEKKLSAEFEQTKIIISKSVKESISASDLLLAVETDINQSFRAKVIQELKQNIVKVSQSMASRNQ